MSKTRGIPEGDLHRAERPYQSRMEGYDPLLDVTRRDPKAAHKAVGDPGCLQRIPDSCLLCEAEALAREAANAAAREGKAEIDG